MESFFHEVFSDKNIVFSVFLIIGTVELLVVYFIYLYRQRIIEGGQEATGQVVDIVSKPRPKGTAFYPVFRFRTYMNEEITYRSKISSRPSPYKAGDEVTIIYNPEKPKQFIIKGDKRFRLALYIMGTIAVVFFLVGFFGLLPVFRRYL